LEHQEFSLQFQPEIRLSDRRIIGFEALLRWNSAEHGSVPPGKFVPLAEKSGTIAAIGEWVLREACRFSRRLHDAGCPGLHVAVNLSPRQLSANNFPEVVREILVETGIEPGQIAIEVTENILIEPMEDSIRKLTELRELGVEVALDDFGTGYSSLTYLRRLPVSILKIDKSFIDGILDDPKQAEYVGFIIDLAHALNLRVVAEGVEVNAQIDKLRELDCDAIQGFVFSRAVSEPAALRLLQDWTEVP
jgi:EAL domain-containing protein (putative c-di-GMP-specific phosphodiesterase class I)